MRLCVPEPRPRHATRRYLLIRPPTRACLRTQYWSRSAGLAAVSSVQVPGLRSAEDCCASAVASWRHAAGQLTFAEYNIRCPEDLHAICTRSASLLDTREFRCVTRAKARGGIGDMVRLRQAGAFLLKSKFVRTLLVTLSSACGVTWAGGPRRLSRQEQSNGLTR